MPRLNKPNRFPVRPGWWALTQRRDSHANPTPARRSRKRGSPAQRNPQILALIQAATTPAGEVLAQLESTDSGLTSEQVTIARTRYGANVVHTYQVRWPLVLLRQFNSPLLILLAVASIGSYAVGEHGNASLILVMIAMSVLLGFFNEYRAERTALDLHRSMSDDCTVLRNGQESRLPVSAIVPGDIVVVEAGAVVPADLRLLHTSGFECDESILTGESLPAQKQTEPISRPRTVTDYSNCAFMGTVVSAGDALGIAITTGHRTHFGALALELGTQQQVTRFQSGMRQFSRLLMRAATGLSAFVFIANVIVQRPLVDALLFALAIAVGIAPEMLTAVVTISLSHGARLLARHKVVVKRLISIEDLGDIEVLFTDKTGTLTEGQLQFEAALDANGRDSADVLQSALLATASGHSPESLQPGHSALDQALWRERGTQAQHVALSRCRVLGTAPFDSERKRSSSLVLDEKTNSYEVLVKGAPESVLSQCRAVPETIHHVVNAQFTRGARVIALARRTWKREARFDAAAERNLEFVGLLIYRDLPKPGVGDAIARLDALGIEVKVLTGDNPDVARQLCADIGIHTTQVLTPTELDAMNDDELAAALAQTRVFARVAPEHKQRIVRAQRALGFDVACLGDGVNDALALREADVGISVDNAVDVAKDAADVVLVEKDLHVLTDGVVQGRRVFANTIKYVSMGASSNFGNMVSAAASSVFLPFLPMLPAQILLNNLLYDVSQFPISTDRVDPEQLQRPSHWDISLIRRYMWFFGLVSSVFDFGTFFLLLRVFHSDVAEFRSTWFLESLSTQTLVVLVIRTRRRPAWLSPPSIGLAIALMGAVAAGACLLWSPWAADLGFTGPRAQVLVAVGLLVVSYLAVVEIAKTRLNTTVRGGRRATGVDYEVGEGAEKWYD